MVDAVLAVKAEFDALASSPGASFTSFSGWRLNPAKGSGNTAGRFAFFTAPESTVGVRGAGDVANTVVGTVGVALFAPVPATPDDDDAFLLDQVAAQLFAAILANSPKRRVTHGGREYQVASEYTTAARLDRPPWAPNQDTYRLDMTIGVEYTRAVS